MCLAKVLLTFIAVMLGPSTTIFPRELAAWLQPTNLRISTLSTTPEIIKVVDRVNRNGKVVPILQKVDEVARAIVEILEKDTSQVSRFREITSLHY